MTRKPLKILIPLFSFGRAGGMRVLTQLANHWKSAGHTVVVLAFYESELPYYPIEAPVIWIDLNGVATNRKESDFSYKNSGIKRSRAFYRYLKKHSSEYDIVLANSNKSTWSVVFGSKAVNFYYIQAYEVEFSYGRSIKTAIKKFSAWITYFLPLHRIVNAEIYKNYKNIRSDIMIPPGLDLNVYYPKKLDAATKKEFVVGCIGREEEWKGANDVGRAVKILRESGYAIRLVVAFHPIRYDNYELVQPHGDDNLAEYYRSLDVLVAPGHLQLGAVHYPVIEAMACNVPVITTGYYPADDTNSYIVSIKSPEQISAAIASMIADYTKAIEKAETAQKLIKQFDWKVVSQKFIEVFYIKAGGESINERQQG